MATVFKIFPGGDFCHANAANFPVLRDLAVAKGILDERTDFVKPFRNAAERVVLEYQERARIFSYPTPLNDDTMSPSEAIELLKAVRILPREQRQMVSDLIIHLGLKEAAS